MQNPAGPVHQTSRVPMSTRRDLTHDGPAIRDHNDDPKIDLHINIWIKNDVAGWSEDLISRPGNALGIATGGQIGFWSKTSQIIVFVY
jgi:hypothetical protein